MKKAAALLAAACSALALASASCGRPPPEGATPRLLAFASIPPVQYFVQRVGGTASRPRPW